MFTGIVAEQGRVTRVKGSGVMELEIEAPQTSRELKVGDSVAVNGVCLTATKVRRKGFHAQVMPETLRLTTLDGLERGNAVNLELPARLSDRLGGHLVQGHVDGVAYVVRIEDDADSRRIWLGATEELLRYMVPKGSVTLDGVSLTIVDVVVGEFQVALIPHTLEVTSLGSLEPGHEVNVEVDVLAKYVERLTKG